MLNFSEWQRPQEEAAEAAEVTLEGEMPPRLYGLMHAEARLRRGPRAARARPGGDPRQIDGGGAAPLTGCSREEGWMSYSSDSSHLWSRSGASSGRGPVATVCVCHASAASRAPITDSWLKGLTR